MRTKKHKARTLSFDRVLELCHRRIRTVATYGGLNTFYEIPGMLVGYPLYNIYECLDYMVDHLRKTGFLVQILPPPQVCVIYVSWDPKELDPRQDKALSRGAPRTSHYNAIEAVPMRPVIEPLRPLGAGSQTPGKNTRKFF